jgi:hypothetical protein
MAKTTYILFASDTKWRIVATYGRGADLSATTPRQLAHDAATALKKLGHGASPIILAVPSSWCLAASIRTDDLPKPNAKSLLYLLEEKIPWPAELIVADFIRHDQTKTALGVCIKTDRIRPFIEALEAEGIPVQTVTPAAILAAQNAVEDSQLQLLRLDSPTGTDLFIIDNGAPKAWASASTDPADVALQTSLLSLDLPETIATIAHSSEDFEPLVLRSAHSLMHAGRTPWIDLRRGDLAASDSLRLHRRPLNALLAAATILLFTTAAFFLWRAHQFDKQAQSAAQQLTDTFSAHYPAWDPPPNVKAVIESEHRRLVSAPASDLPAHATDSALTTLYAILANLPDNSSFNLQRLTANPDSLDIEAQLTSYEDADAIAAAARKAGLNVPPPQVRKEPSGLWSLTLHATRAKPVADATPTKSK